jgi:hypothetical protein
MCCVNEMRRMNENILKCKMYVTVAKLRGERFAMNESDSLLTV